MPVPKQKPGRSKQDYGTPWPFVRAVERYLGVSFAIDLAASEANRKAPRFYSVELNGLLQPWATDLRGRWGWCNPPYANIGDWTTRALAESQRGAKTVLLLPAGVSTNWFDAAVHRRANVIFVRPRLTFEGCLDPYPKDLMLVVYGRDGQDYYTWDWTSGGSSR